VPLTVANDSAPSTVPAAPATGEPQALNPRGCARRVCRTSRGHPRTVPGRGSVIVASPGADCAPPAPTGGPTGGPSGGSPPHRTRARSRTAIADLLAFAQQRLTRSVGDRWPTMAPGVVAASCSVPIAHLAAPVGVPTQMQHLGKRVGGHVGETPDARAGTAPTATQYCDHALSPKRTNPASSAGIPPRVPWAGTGTERNVMGPALMAPEPGRSPEGRGQSAGTFRHHQGRRRAGRSRPRSRPGRRTGVCRIARLRVGRVARGSTQR
jgi:hypothetical protein